jgi:pSer/pThr/pTyr-binding forkhead associated (FHA) protein
VPGDWCLDLVREGQPTQRTPITRSVWGVGRHPANDLVIDSRSLSRFHARFERRGHALVVLDLGAANGILVNEADAGAERALAVGDVVTLGRERLVVVTPDLPLSHAAAAATPASPGAVRQLLELMRDGAVSEVIVTPPRETAVIRAGRTELRAPIDAQSLRLALASLGALPSADAPVFDGAASKLPGWHVTAHALAGDLPHARFRRRATVDVDDDVDPLPPA